MFIHEKCYFRIIRSFVVKISYTMGKIMHGINEKLREETK